MSARRLLFGLLLILTAAAPIRAQETHLVVVTGLGGTPEMRETFHGWAVRLVDAARARFALPDDRVVYLAERTEMDPDRIDARSTRANLAAAVERLAGAAGPDGRLLLVFLGHGSWDGEEARFNLPGPDLTAAGLGTMLDDAWGDRTVAVVNAASASGAFVPALSGPGRIVVTATRSGREQNATEFGGHFVDALAGEGADANEDGALSLLEAFDYARQRVARSYEERNLLLTEHAQLDDDGDGKAALEPDPGSTDDGDRAARFVLGAEARTAAADDPALQALYEERRLLEERVREMRERKAEMEEGAYRDSLEVLLLDLARLNRRIQAAGGGGP